MASLTRALAWKEWREQRGVVLAGLALAASMPFILMAGSSASARGVDLPGIAEALPGLIITLVWPLFAAACGASTVAGEIGEGTLGFLLSRPVSRARVWVVKVAAGLSALAAIVAGSLAVSWLFGLAVGGDGLRVVRLVGGAGAPAGPPWPPLAPAVFLLFSASVFFSTFLSRALTAAAAGLAGSLLVLSGIMLSWSRLDLIPRLEPELLAAEILLTGALILLASSYVFSRGELLGGSRLRRTLATAILMVLAGSGLIGVPLAVTRLRLSPDDAILLRASVSPRGDGVAATAATPQGGSPQIWMVHADGSGFRRVAGRLTLGAAFSPGGEWLAYLSYRGALGLRTDRAALHMVRADGGRDRLLAGGLELEIDPRRFIPGLAFSPDGSHVAVVGAEEVVVAPVEGGEPATISLAGTDLEGGLLLGWTAESHEVLLASPPWRQQGESLVAALDPRKGSTRAIYRGALSTGALFWQPAGPAAGTTWVPLLIGADEEGISVRELVVLDVNDGVLTEISDSACPFGLDLSEDGSRLAWIECQETAEEVTISRAHVLDLSTMTGTVLGSFHGDPLQVRLSPTGRRLAVRRRGAESPPLVLEAGGGIRELAEGWIPLGWSGRNRVVLEGERRLAVVDVATGALRQIHPPTPSTE